MTREEHLLEIKDLKLHYPVRAGLMRRQVGSVKAVDGVTLDIRRGEILGLVGESGCGKSSFGRCILQLHKATSGQVLYNDQDLVPMKKKEVRALRKHLQMICQDPFSSLDPRQTVGSAVGEGLQIHNLAKGKEIRRRVEELFTMVGLDPSMMNRYPHEFSGGQRQRVGIARALAVNPEFIVCDEPVSALDVSIQAQIIHLLKELRRELDLTYLFIGHDLSVVRSFSDRVAVMYLGKLMEVTASSELYTNPLHPYTKALLSAVPIPDPVADRQRERILLKGEVPSPMNPPEGCRFCTRCPHAQERCRTEEPLLRPVGGEHWVACHFAEGKEEKPRG